MAMDKDTQTATRDAAQRTRAAGEDALRAGEATTRRAAEATRSIIEEAAGTSRTATEAGGEFVRRGAETAQETASAASRVAGDTAGQFQRLLGLSADAQGEVAQQTRRNMDAILQCGTVLMDGWQSIMREWMGLAQEATQRNVDGINALARSRSVPDLYAAQSNLLKDSMELLLSRSVKVSELSAKTADSAVRRLNTRAEAAAQQTYRSNA